jgi:thioredoxin 1
MPASLIVNLNQSNFTDEVLQSETPVVVDFWAEWCGPCKMIAPLIDELAGEYEGRIKFAKLNIDDEQALATEHGIRAIPTLLFFKGGEVVDQMMGGRINKRDLKANLDRVTV